MKSTEKQVRNTAVYGIECGRDRESSCKKVLEWLGEFIRYALMYAHFNASNSTRYKRKFGVIFAKYFYL